MSDSDLSTLLPVVSNSPEETIQLGRDLSKLMTAGMVVGLYGEVGAGKTQLVKGICSGLDYPMNKVHSPTFTIVNEYEGRLPIYHFDAYRVRSVEEFYDLGYEDYFFGGGVCLIEWADRVESLIPEDSLRIALIHDGPTHRRIQPLDRGA